MSEEKKEEINEEINEEMKDQEVTNEEPKQPWRKRAYELNQVPKKNMDKKKALLDKMKGIKPVK